MALALQSTTIDEIDRHARETYPEECCGIVLRDGDREIVRRIANVQDRMHAQDPVAHPRDARIAYFMDPAELGAVLREADAGKSIAAFYHSHPEHGAYFSEEDRERAMFGDEPAYPDAAWLVVSVIGREVRDRKAFAWDSVAATFVDVPLTIG